MTIQKYKRMIRISVVVSGLLATSLLHAQSVDKQLILSGQYTKEQAARGERTFKTSCQTCHIPRDYRGIIQKSDNSGAQISAYFDLISQTMPQDAPGSLSTDAYLNVIAYILSLNEFPATGTAEEIKTAPDSGAAPAESEPTEKENNVEASTPTSQVDNDNNEIEEIRVAVTRLDRSLYDVSYAVSVVNKDDIQLGRQLLGLDESLNRVPGMFFQNRYNFTQDLRVSIRGFGARANFGIRGLKIFADGIPATLTDGQSGTDDLDLGSVEKIEIIRGPASSLYGSASGGVISLYTESGPDIPFVEASINIGEYDNQKYQIKAGGQYDKLNYLVNASTMSMDGYRDHSRVKHSLVNSKFRYDINDTSSLTVVLNAVDSPQADDPGAITTAQVVQDRQQAEPRNLSSNAGETLEQQRFGMIYNKDLGTGGKLTLSNYYLWRDFSTILPLGSHIPNVAADGVVEFDRFFWGGSGQYSRTSTLFGLLNNTTIGFDIDAQKDDRQRFINNAGVKGNLTFDQLEHAQSYGFYLHNELSMSDSTILSLGGRYDKIELEVEDRFLSNADQSSKLDFDEFSPSIGLSWRPRENLSFYTNYAYAFETPTFTELANPARSLNVNLGGFANVDAQAAHSFEVGTKGRLFDRINYDFAVYTANVDDEVISTVNIGDRSFFQNADTDRQGLEAAINVDIVEGLKASMAYTYSDFKFKTFENVPLAEGNNLPGLPDHQFYTELAYRHGSGFFATWDILYISDVFVDNLNSLANPGYHVSNFRAGRGFDFDDVDFSIFLGVNNIFDKQYNSNIAINAFGGRYFEPAPLRNYYGGLSARLSFN